MASEPSPKILERMAFSKAQEALQYAFRCGYQVGKMETEAKVAANEAMKKQKKQRR